jgi:tetratricopeptide (TPR) repeat protein
MPGNARIFCAPRRSRQRGLSAGSLSSGKDSPAPGASPPGNVDPSGRRVYACGPLRFLVLSSVLLVCGPSFAQAPPASAKANEQAHASFARGMEAYEQGRFRAAIEHFKEADRLAPSPRLSFNIALSYERMSDGPNALAAYRDYLRRSPEAANVPTTSVRIAELELELQKSGVQQLTVLSDPTGANVLIDDLSRGVTPWTGELPPGPHRVLLRARGYSDTAQSFELPARHAIDLIYTLEPVASTPVAAVPLAPPSPAWAPVVAASPPPPVPADVQQPAQVQWWTWAALGSSAAALIGAGAFELSRRQLETELHGDELTQTDTPETYDRMLARRTAARVCLGTGLALGALGGVSLYFDLRRKEGSAGVGFACAGGECTAFTRGYW